MPQELVRNSESSHFVPASADLRQTLQKRGETIRGVSHADLGLPEELQGYHTLVPLEPTGAADRKKLGNWHSTVYRAIRTTDGVPHVLRRIESESFLLTSHFVVLLFFFLSKVGWDANCGRVLVIFTDYRMTNQAAFAPIEIWSRIHHPSIVPVREAFTTLSFNDNCAS